MARGLYIHIPFCSDICSYCDFCKVIYNEKIAKEYIQNVKIQLKNDVKEEITSIYVGGGTPSSLSKELLEELLISISPYVKDGISYAFEANIDSLSEEKIALLHKYHINRVSLGVQSFNDDILKDMRRHHNKEDVIKTINKLHQFGIHDINIDLIYGYPNQTLEMIRNDVNIAMELPISHISTYALTVNDNTFLKVRGVEEQNEDELSIQYDLIRHILKEHGFERYEVSNFSKKGYESQHNLVYWRNEEYYGIGAGASGYIGNCRYDITRSIPLYIKGKRIVEEEILTKEDEEYYFMMLGLRLEEGVSLTRFRNLYNDDMYEKYPNLINLINDGLLKKEGDNIKVQENYLFILDFILERLL